MEQRTGKRAALWALFLGIATVLVAGIAFRDRILEEWYLHRIENDDEDVQKAAARWLGEHGGDRVFLVMCEKFIHDSPEFLLMKKPLNIEVGKTIDMDMEPMARDYCQKYAMRDAYLDGSSLRSARMKVTDRIRERLGQERISALCSQVFMRDSGSPRLRVYTAKNMIFYESLLAPGPGAIDLAIRRLGESLNDPDPLVRAGSAYGLAEAGPENRAQALSSLETIRNDRDPLVREAFEFATRKLQGESQ